MSEDLANYYTEVGVRLPLHALRNRNPRAHQVSSETSAKASTTSSSASTCFREGLDLPEVSLVAILDADKEGFLRSQGSLIQTIGRAARHLEGRAILYADKMTDSMQRAIDETDRRRDQAGGLQRGARHHPACTVIRSTRRLGLATILKADYADLTEDS